jgi:hypothetical protein
VKPQPITQPNAGATIHHFTTCKLCIRLRRALKDLGYTCSACDCRRLAEMNARVEREVDAWVRTLLVSVLIVGVFVGLLVFANAVRPWL